MATIRTGIELQDNFTGVLYSIINAVNSSVSAMENLQQTMNAPVDAASLDAARNSINQATLAVQELETAVQNIQTPTITSPIIEQPVSKNLNVDVTPVVTEQAQIDVPGEVTVDVNPIVTQQPDLNIPESVTVDVQAATATAEQRIADIQQQLQGVNRMQEAINTVANNAYILPDDTMQELTSINREIRRMQAALDYIRDNPFNLDSSYATLQIENLTNGINTAIQRQQELNSQLGNMPEQIVNVQVNADVPNPLVDQSEPVQVPVHWQSDNIEVFMGTGVERFEQEVQSANNMLNTLNQTQNRIAETATQTNLFPANAVADMDNMQTRLQAIQQRIETIESNPMNMGSDIANAELEQLRGQLAQAAQEQENLNRAVENMDVQAANQSYLRLSQTIGNTERYIRDNVDEQGRFNREIQEGADSAAHLKNMIASAVGAYVGIARIKKAFSFVEDCTELFNTQLNAENQLMVVLGNMLDEDYVSQFEIDTYADTTAAIDEINSIQNSVDEVVIPISASGKALQAEFDIITEKASEIQGKGIYGDEAMIAGAAEFATYFSDVNAITMMMDTLSNYAMGMSGGGALDSSAMVNYATGLGKIMTGSYESMTKKGFEFSDVQKDIIEGTATQEQIIAVLGEEYAGMSSEMQAAAAISQVIEESWGNLYETMSNTPEGKIIQMNNTWGDMKEVIGGQLYPYVLLFVDAVTENWGTIDSIVQGITIGLKFMLGVLSWVLETVIFIANSVIENWSWISPIIYGVAGALAVYYGWLLLTKGAALATATAQGILTVAKMLAVPIYAALTGATMADTAAQWGLNSAMYACPLVWIIILIIALISVFYGAVAAVNHFAETSVSATGLIGGYFASLGAYIINTYIIPIWNVFAALANFLGNVFTNPVAAVKVLFYDMCIEVIGYIKSLAEGIETLLNKIPGVTIDITSGLDSFYAGLERASQTVKDESGWVEYVGKMNYIDYGKAASAGYEFGKRIEDSISNFNIDDLFNTNGIPSPEEYANSFMGLGFEGIGSGIDDIAKNTGAIKDSVNITEEDLKYLRDIAEQEVINRYTTAEINIDMSGMNNTIKNNDDLDGFVSELTDAVNEAVYVMAEGVY